MNILPKPKLSKLPAMRFEDYQQTRRLPNLDGLRGIAIVLPMAWASYRFFENPVRKYGAGLSKALGQRSANRYVKKVQNSII